VEGAEGLQRWGFWFCLLDLKRQQSGDSSGRERLVFGFWFSGLCLGFWVLMAAAAEKSYGGGWALVWRRRLRVAAAAARLDVAAAAEFSGGGEEVL
jgi:hypothetical protein